MILDVNSKGFIISSMWSSLKKILAQGTKRRFQEENYFICMSHSLISGDFSLLTATPPLQGQPPKGCVEFSVEHSTRAMPQKILNSLTVS